MKNIYHHFVILFVLVAFSACNEMPIVHDLNEHDANEIIVLLAKNNIPTVKVKEERNQEIFWSITVEPEYQIQAQGILVANNLPHIRQGGLEGICKNTSMIVTEETEKCRKLLAYKGEIINSLESIPGVVSADVVLNIPDKDPFPDENTATARPSAAVTIKYLVDANVKTSLNEGKIQEFVSNSISGMDSRDVTVVISYVNQKIDENISSTNGTSTETQNTAQKVGTDVPPVTNEDTLETPTELVNVGGIQMDEDSAKKFKIISALFLVLLLLLSAAFIYALFKMSRMRKTLPVKAETVKDGDDQKLLEA